MQIVIVGRTFFKLPLGFFLFYSFMQEGPENITVFNTFTRTTGALEAYNGALGHKIIKRGHFFKFVKVLLDEEFAKCRDFYSRIEGRDDGSNNRGNKYQIRGEKIKRNSNLLANGQITCEEFLNRIVYKQNNLDFGLIDVDNVNIVIDDGDDSDSEESPSEPTSFNSHKIAKGKCVLCSVNEPELCVIPCFDFCVCVSCWNILKENSNSELKCPLCSSTASDAKMMNFV